MSTTLRHACSRCEAWIPQEQGLCAVCRAKDAQWPLHDAIRGHITDLEADFDRLARAAREDTNEARAQWAIETYREAQRKLNHALGLLEELEEEHNQP